MDFSTLVALVRRNVGAATPQSGGKDVLGDAFIIEYLNDAFTMLNDSISGFPFYTEFTIQTDGTTIAVTKPASNAPTVAITSPQEASYRLFTVDDARAYTLIENLTTGVAKTWNRRLDRTTFDNRNMQAYWNSSGSFYTDYDILGKRGWMMFPLTITKVQTIGVTYRRNFIRYAVTDPDQTTGSGLDDLTVSGIYTGNTRFDDDKTYDIKITTAATPDTYAVSVDGGAYGSDANCSTTATDMDSPSLGLKIAFGATTGHILNDVWRIAATAPSLDELEEEEQRTFPVFWAKARLADDLDEDRVNRWYAMAVGPDYYVTGYIAGALKKFIDNRMNIDLSADYDLSNPLEVAYGA